MYYTTHPWNTSPRIFLFHMAMSLLFFSTINSFFISSDSKVSYSDHCASFVPEPTRPVHYGNYTSAFHTGFLVTRKPDEFSDYFELNLGPFYESDIQGLFGVGAKVSLLTRRNYFFAKNISGFDNFSSSIYQFRARKYNRRRTFRLRLQGFWSQSDGKLCVVGEGFIRGESNHIPALLKLYNLYNSTNITSLITGSLESLVGSGQNDRNYLDPVSFVLYPSLNYEYSLVSQELVDGYGSNSGTESDVVSPSLPINSLTHPFCFLIFNRWLGLKYKSDCRSASSAKKCSPLGDLLGQIPDAVTLQSIECFKDPERPRLLIKFQIDDQMWGYDALNPKAALIGEGIWDAKKNRLFVVGCRVLNATDSWAKARVGDCSTRLSLSFPAVWKIGNTVSIVGRIWSAKPATEPGYFEEIRFQSSDDGPLARSPDMKYEYTKIDEARKWCPRKETSAKSEGKTYPDVFSNDMTFDVAVKRKKFSVFSGYAVPISVGDQVFTRQLDSNLSDRDFAAKSSYVTYPTNMSYRISLFNVSWELRGMFDSISAEGTYDVTTGSLCMVGCRNVGSNSSSDLSSDDDSLDCEILVNFQFPPRNAKENEGFIKGSIESKRKKSDPLYFESLNLTSTAYVAAAAEESIWKADLEIISGFVSNTLACVFAVLQIFHLRRNPGFFPFVSLTMLLTLTFGYSIPLVTDLKSMITSSFESRDALLGTGGWLNTKVITEGITGSLLFLLQARLLQLAWSSRQVHESRNELRMAEKEAFMVSMPLYFGGAFSSVFFAWSKRNHEIATFSLSLTANYNDNPLWDALKSYADVLSDGFLFPQVLLNVFADSRGKSLSCSFYIGTTLLRVFSRACDLYKARNSAFDLASTAWNVIVPFGSLLFAAVIYLQHKFGGRCFLRHSESPL